MRRPTEIRTLPDGPIKDRAVARSVRLTQAIRRPWPDPPARDPRRLLCGCIEPEVGPSVVMADGACFHCSPL